MGRLLRSGWLSPVGLLTLCIIPVGIGIYGLATGTIGTDIGETTPKWDTVPLPLAIHITAISLFVVLGALQFAPALRRFAWHRIAGRIAFLAGLIGAAAGIWTTLTVTEGSGLLLITGRLVVGSAIFASIILSINAVRNRRLMAHRAWNIRAYALAITAGTLPFVYLPVLLIFGEPSYLFDEVIQVSAWLLNLAVAERIIRRNPETSLPTQHTFD